MSLDDESDESRSGSMTGGRIRVKLRCVVVISKRSTIGVS